MTWQTRSSFTPKVLSENQWQLHWLTVELSNLHIYLFGKVKSIGRRAGLWFCKLQGQGKASRLLQLFDKLLNRQYLSQFLASKSKYKNALKATKRTSINSFKHPLNMMKTVWFFKEMTGFWRGILCAKNKLKWFTRNRHLCLCLVLMRQSLIGLEAWFWRRVFFEAFRWLHLVNVKNDAQMLECKLGAKMLNYEQNCE